MIRLQIIERDGAGLYSELISAMRDHTLQTFRTTKRGKRVLHSNHPGWMRWSHSSGVIVCEVLSPRKPGNEWRFLHAFVGRLADRYAEKIQNISIQFPEVNTGKKRRKRS